MPPDSSRESDYWRRLGRKDRLGLPQLAASSISGFLLFAAIAKPPAMHVIDPSQCRFSDLGDLILNHERNFLQDCDRAWRNGMGLSGVVAFLFVIEQSAHLTDPDRHRL